MHEIFHHLFLLWRIGFTGDEGGSVDRHHNVPGRPALSKPDPARLAAERQLMKYDTYFLDQRRRTLVLEAIQEVCVPPRLDSDGRARAYKSRACDRGGESSARERHG